jgi:hypothetical protein
VYLFFVFVLNDFNDRLQLLLLIVKDRYNNVIVFLDIKDSFRPISCYFFIKNKTYSYNLELLVVSNDGSTKLQVIKCDKFTQ